VIALPLSEVENTPHNGHASQRAGPREASRVAARQTGGVVLSSSLDGQFRVRKFSTGQDSP